MKDPLSLLPGYALRRASVTMMGALSDALQALDLRFTESTVLILIGANPGIRQRDLVGLLDIKRANMTPLIARLEAQGWVARTAMDGRSWGLSLTPAGMDLHDRVWSVVQNLETRMLSHVPDDLVPAFQNTLVAIWRQW